MNTKGHTNDQVANQVRRDQPSSFIKQKGRVDTPVEVTMSDIAQKLRTVYAQMQMKHSSRPLNPQGVVEEHFKSYLDDISRAILAEYYIRRQREKRIFESLEQIKTLVQSLQSEKKSLKEAAITRQMPHSKLSDSVVQKLAQMECEENQERLLLQKTQKFSGQNSITPLQTNVENVLQQENKSSLPSNTLLPSDALKSSFKKTEEAAEHIVIEEKGMEVPTSNHCSVSHHCLENDFSPTLKAQSRRYLSFLSYFVKNSVLCFLTVAFIGVITLCFYSFLKGARFF
ncbi:hypothetical protein MNL08_06350 [Bartonella krasnovii]|uniref:hypothetical protein n=1 Tax=Bartonella krasnovii TaxID=2267275 RepID=UPI001F4D2AD0|nr:hypothetical protein [Bartonella krasnovii]UNF36637.1 hypothetical protein MNL11_05890 [Bartonella krasnovii]UNF41797.1 hypothetical protein MNL08_06350 [Bartonella krasnovii]UNF45044.1 hypothetical protein MNL06_05630 [Bartonella krasnovii]UNF55001.1 hypothetical protein MNL00_06355 [Bartonella krasnovii]